MPITEQQLLPQDEWRAVGDGVAAYEAERLGAGEFWGASPQTTIHGHEARLVNGA